MQTDHLTILKDNSIKVTPQRLTILNLLGQHGHLSIKEIFSEIKPVFPSISLATIYKNINFLIEKSLLKEVKLTDMDSKYEITKAPHAHLVCTECHSVEDIDIDMQSIVKEFEKQSGFLVSSNSLELSGVCSACR
ncbi:MAG: Fur family transcriptional regulator [Campylobacterota bacterium]